MRRPAALRLTLERQREVSVGLVGENEDEAAEEQAMRPAKDLDDALSIARDLLSGQTGDQAQEAMKVGFNRVGAYGQR